MITPAESFIYQLLKKVPIFSVLDDRELRELAALGQMRRFRKEELIFLQGDPGKHFFIILQGKVRIYLQDPRGREVILDVLGDEDFFGEMSLLDGKARSASAQAMAETRVFSIGHDEFYKFLERAAAVPIKLLRLMSERLRRADETIENLALLSVKGRLARLLASWCEHDGKPSDGTLTFKLPMPKTQIAQMLGTSRETVSRMMSELHDEKQIHMDGNTIRIPSLDNLKQIP
jgi:CRP-like cAMP-binding protein